MLPGKRRFESALDGFARRDAVQVRWRSFELDPHGSRRANLTLPERHRRDVGGTPEQARQRIGALSDLAAQSGLTYRLDLARPVNSFDAHRLMQYADQEGVGEPVRERLLLAYTGEGAVLSDHETLARLGAEAGLDPAATLEMLGSADFTESVRKDEALGRRLGVSGVPTFVFALYGRRLLPTSRRPGREGLCGRRPLPASRGLARVRRFSCGRGRRPS
ncbi:DsbA family oxidoreductase [Nonomuraea dietziae]|uniref:DsbA family oxidoreductase n=1 Tax=Nonomuraea dietziae TaxID=65515 RepID=UPI0033D6FC1A